MRPDLPGGEAGGTEQVAAGLYPDVLAVLRADLAQLARGQVRLKFFSEDFFHSIFH